MEVRHALLVMRVTRVAEGPATPRPAGSELSAGGNELLKSKFVEVVDGWRVRVTEGKGITRKRVRKDYFEERMTIVLIVQSAVSGLSQ